jgi:DNA-binding transcriptional LysR family regulator
MRLRDLPLVSLRTFAVVADCGSVTAAAETLGVTHSAVSKQVKLLERWLGQTLFILEGRGIVLTPFGDILSGKLGSAFEDIAGACAYVQRHSRERISVAIRKQRKSRYRRVLSGIPSPSTHPLPAIDIVGL